MTRLQDVQQDEVWAVSQYQNILKPYKWYAYGWLQGCLPYIKSPQIPRFCGSWKENNPRDKHVYTEYGLSVLNFVSMSNDLCLWPMITRRVVVKLSKDPCPLPNPKQFICCWWSRKKCEVYYINFIWSVFVLRYCFYS